MPIRAEYVLVCEDCKKEYKKVLSDAILPKEQNELNHPMCKTCKIKKLLRRQ